MKESKTTAAEEISVVAVAGPCDGLGDRPTIVTARENCAEDGPNPLLSLSEKKRAELFALLRECPTDAAKRYLLKDMDYGEVSPSQLTDFLQQESVAHQEQRIERAAQAADALVAGAEESAATYSKGILNALGQEAFRQIASGSAESESMVRLASLFLKARTEDRQDRMQELQREKLRRELQGQIEHALDLLAEEIDRYPQAREAFEILRKEIAAGAAKQEEE